MIAHGKTCVVAGRSMNGGSAGNSASWAFGPGPCAWATPWERLTLADIEGAFRRYVPNAELHLTQPSFSEHLSGSLTQGKTDEAQVEAQFERLMKGLLAGLPKDD